MPCDGSPCGCWKIMQCMCWRLMPMTTNTAGQCCRKLARPLRRVLVQILRVPWFETIQKLSSAASHFPSLDGPAVARWGKGNLETGFADCSLELTSMGLRLLVGPNT